MPPSSSSRNAPFQPPGRWPVWGGEEWGLQLSRSPGSLRPQSADWVPFCFRQHHPPPAPPPTCLLPLPAKCREHLGHPALLTLSGQQDPQFGLQLSSLHLPPPLPPFPFPSPSLPPLFLPSSSLPFILPPPSLSLFSLPLLPSLPSPPSLSFFPLSIQPTPPPAPTHRAQAHHPLPLVCPWPCTSHLVTNPITDVRPRSPSARTQAQGPLRLVLTAHGG